MALPGLEADRVDAALLAATGNFATVVAAAIEARAELIEPSHILIALARLRDGLTCTLFAADDIPVDVFVNALRNVTNPATATVITACTEDTISEATREALNDLATAAPGRPLGERDILAALLSHLEPTARDILVEHGGADLARWLREASTTALEPVALFGADGQLAVDGFTPTAQTVLTNLVTEASALGHRELGTLLLLHAMALVPHGLIEQATLILRFDQRELRAQVLIPLRGRTPRHVVETTLDASTIGTSLRLALERAAASAAGRGAGLIAEQDLLAGLLDSPAGLAAAALRAAGIDVTALRQYADEVYTEPAAPAPTTVTMSVQESLDWLRANLIGQDGVVDRLLPRIELIKRAARRGFRIGERPLGTFLFCGPSGTGKTMTARLLAKVIYGSTDDLIVFEMGQFNTHYSINNLIGAPPGYVGFGEGQLTNGLLRQPRSVLLFDEVEKAHPLVFDALLRLLDEGRVNDPAGPVRDARDAVIVLTSNLGAKEFATLGRIRNQAPDVVAALEPARPHPEVSFLIPDGATDGEAEADEFKITARLHEVLGTFLRPEFLNRIDETILFELFGPRELEAIAVASLRDRAEQVSASLGVELNWDVEVPGQLVRDATRWRPNEAARGVNRCVDDVLQLVLRALDDAEDRGKRLTATRVVVQDGLLTVEGRDG